MVESIIPISARLIVNKSSFKFSGTAIEQLVAGLSRQIKEEAL